MSETMGKSRRRRQRDRKGREEKYSGETNQFATYYKTQTIVCCIHSEMAKKFP